jgi:hypothetical protein
MKTLVRWFGIIAFAAVIVVSMVSCETEMNDEGYNVEIYEVDVDTYNEGKDFSVSASLELAKDEAIETDDKWVADENKLKEYLVDYLGESNQFDAISISAVDKARALWWFTNTDGYYVIYIVNNEF